MVAIVLPAKADLSLLKADEAAVGDSDAMGVAAEIGEDLCRPAEGRLGVDDPLDPPQPGQVSDENDRVGQISEIAEEMELAGLEGLPQVLQEQSPEQSRQDPHGQKYSVRKPTLLAANPRQVSTWHDAVDVPKMAQILAPGVQHADHADLSAQMLGIGGSHPQSFGRGLEQDRIDRRLVMESDLGDLRRHGEDHVEVWDRQQLGLTLGQPLGASQSLTFGTMAVAAGIIGLAHKAAVGAVFDVTAQGCSPARLNRRHDPRSTRPRRPSCSRR